MILAADDVRDLEVDVVHDAGQRVEEPPILADQHRVRQRRRIDMHGTADDVVELNLFPGQQEAPMRLAPLSLKGRPLLRGELQRRAVVDWRLVLCELALAPPVKLIRRFITRIEPASRAQLLGRRIVLRRPLRLLGKEIVLQPQPSQVGIDPLRERLRRPVSVRIVEAKQKLAARLAREQIVGERRANIADVNLACRAGGEANNRCHGRCLAVQVASRKAFVIG